MQYIVLGITLLILFSNVLTGMRRGLWRGLLRLVTLLISVVAAFFAAKVTAAAACERMSFALEQIFASNPGFVSFLQSNPAIGQSAGALAQMLVTPILFLLFYILFKIVTLVLYCILRVFVKKSRFFATRWIWGAAMGALAGVIGILVFVTPVMGYTQMLSNTITKAESLSATSDLALGEYNEKYIKPVSTAPLASQIYNGVGSKLFVGLTTVKWNEKKVDLASEWSAVMGVVDNAAAFGKRPVAEYGAAESEAAHAMAKGVGESQLLSSLGGGALNGISNAWLSGEAFMGIQKPNTGDESIDIILNGFLRVFSQTSPEMIGEDLDYFADVFDLLLKYEVFSKIGAGGSSDDLVIHLSASGFLTEVRVLLTSNARMEPVVNAISDAGMRLLVRELGDPSTYLEQHKELLDNMSNVLKDAVNQEGQVDKAAVSSGLQSALAEKQVEVPAEAVDIIAEGLVDEFTVEDLTTLSIEELTDRLIERFGNTENIAGLIAAQPAA